MFSPPIPATLKKKTSQGGEHFIVKVPLKSIHKRTRMQGVTRVVPQLVSITWWVAIQKNKHNLRTEETKNLYENSVRNPRFSFGYKFDRRITDI